MSFVAPDWKIEDNYPDPGKETSLLLWTWEFLRRNSDYQTAWRQYAERLQIVTARLPELGPIVDLLAGGPDRNKPDESLKSTWSSLYDKLENQVEFSLLTPDALSGENTLDDWRKRVNGGAYSVVPLGVHLGEAWEMRHIVNPAFSYSQAFHTFNRVDFMNRGGGLHVIRGDTKSIDYANCITPVFDLRRPVNVLKAEFAAVLRHRAWRIKEKHITPYKGRPDKSLQFFRNYLRVIDASDMGVSVADIAPVLLPKQDAEGRKKTVQNWKIKGNKIRKGEFRILPAYNTDFSKKK